MFIYESKTRVRYSETDKMGFVYYGRYSEYFEIGRTELMRNLGFAYKDFEENGMMMPVTSFSIKFLKPAIYDEILTIRTFLKEIPAARLTFYYEIYNSNNELITTGETKLAFIESKSNKIMRAPKELINKLKIFFNH